MSKTAKEGVSLTKFGEILMQLRQEKHLSQAELGHIIYVSGGTISNYEKGPSVELSSIRTTYPSAIDTAIVNSHTLVFFLKI